MTPDDIGKALIALVGVILGAVGKVIWARQEKLREDHELLKNDVAKNYPTSSELTHAMTVLTHSIDKLGVQLEQMRRDLYTVRPSK